MTDEQLIEIALKHGFSPAMLAGGSSAVAGKPEQFLPLLRAIEQASRRAALEEAAKHAESWGEARMPDHGGNALRNCAISIRALADGGTRC